MKRSVSTILFCCLAAISGMQAQQKSARIKLNEVTLMHEMLSTPSPLDKATVNDRAVSFQWPLHADVDTSEEVLDGMKSTKEENRQVAIEIPVTLFTECSHEEQCCAGGKPLAFL